LGSVPLWLWRRTIWGNAVWCTFNQRHVNI
jgi:hypothetical protein